MKTEYNMKTKDKNQGQLDHILKTFRNNDVLKLQTFLPQLTRDNNKNVVTRNINSRENSQNMRIRQDINIKAKTRSLSSTQYLMSSLNNTQNQQQIQVEFVNKIEKDVVFKNQETQKLNKTYDVQMQAYKLKQLYSDEINQIQLQQNQNTMKEYQSPNQIKIEQTQIQDNKELNNQQENSSKLEKYQDTNLQNQQFSLRKKPKGPSKINIKVLELWINDTIFEAGTGNTVNMQGEQKSVKKSGLKSFCIDRKNLKSKGISMENIDRMYRCLFVYSFGFYEMLYSIFEHAQDQSILIANIWKVYGVLLEYCSRSDFQATVSVLENEKKVHVQQLQLQINKNENIISEMEDRDKQEKERLMNDLKLLHIQRENLEMEKQLIEEDFKQADLAFNEELTLRLKFEHRINEIHSIHREVVIQHERLLADFLAQKDEKTLWQADIKEQRTKMVEILNLKNILTEELRLKDMALHHKQKENLILIERVSILEKKSEDRKLNDDSKVNIMKDYERSIEDFKFKLNNLQNQLSISQKTIKDINEQSKDLISDKLNLNEKIKVQQKENEALRNKVYELEQQLAISIKETELLKERTEEQKQISKNWENQYLICIGQKKKLEVDLDFNKQRIVIQDSDIKAMDQVILDMKLARNELEDQYIKLKIKLDNNLEELKVKSEFNKNLDIQLSDKHMINYKLIIKFNQLTEQFNSEKQLYQKSQEVLQQQIIQMGQEYEKKQIQFKQMRDNDSQIHKELEQSKILLSGTQQQLKNQLYLIDNNNQQINTLKQVLERERDRIDVFVKQIGILQIDKEQLLRDNKSLTFISKEKQENYEYNLKKLQERNLQEVKKCRYDYQTIHYMKFEDIQSQLMRTYNQLLQSEKDKSMIQEILSNQLQQLENDKSKVQESYQNMTKKYVNLQKDFKIQTQDLDILGQKLKEKINQLNIIILRQKKLSSKKEQYQLNLNQNDIQIQKLSKEVLNLNQEIKNLQQINQAQIEISIILQQSNQQLEILNKNLFEQLQNKKTISASQQDEINDRVANLSEISLINQSIKSINQFSDSSLRKEFVPTIVENISEPPLKILQSEQIKLLQSQMEQLESQSQIKLQSSQLENNQLNETLVNLTQKLEIQQSKIIEIEEKNNQTIQIQNQIENQNKKWDSENQIKFKSLYQENEQQKETQKILRKKLEISQLKINELEEKNNQTIQTQNQNQQNMSQNNITQIQNQYDDQQQINVQTIISNNNQQQTLNSDINQNLNTEKEYALIQNIQTQNSSNDQFLNAKSNLNSLSSNEMLEQANLNQTPQQNKQISTRNLNQIEIIEYQKSISSRNKSKEDIFQEFDQNNFIYEKNQNSQVQNIDKEFNQQQQKQNNEQQQNQLQNEEQKYQLNDNNPNQQSERKSQKNSQNQEKRQNNSVNVQKHMNPNSFSRQFQITSQYYNVNKKQ